MAQITINNAVINRIFDTKNGQGVSIYENVTIEFGKNKGDEFKAYYTVWLNDDESDSFADAGYDEGDTLTISGRLSTRVSEYEDKKTGETKRGVDISINNPTWDGAGAAVADEDDDEGF